MLLARRRRRRRHSRGDGGTVVDDEDKTGEEEEEREAFKDQPPPDTEEEEEKWWLQWQLHLKSVLPRWVLRTRPVRDFAEKAASGGGEEGKEGEEASSEALRRAWGYLRSPFTRQPFPTHDGGDEVGRRLAALPTRSEGRLQTSCGGQ